MQLGEQSYMMSNNLLAQDILARKLVVTSKGKLRDNRHNDAEIYPEVHVPMEANPSRRRTKVKDQCLIG